MSTTAAPTTAAGELTPDQLELQRARASSSRRC